MRTFEDAIAAIRSTDKTSVADVTATFAAIESLLMERVAKSGPIDKLKPTPIDREAQENAAASHASDFANRTRDNRMSDFKKAPMPLGAASVEPSEHDKPIFG